TLPAFASVFVGVLTISCAATSDSVMHSGNSDDAGIADVQVDTPLPDFDAGGCASCGPDSVCYQGECLTQCEVAIKWKPSVGCEYLPVHMDTIDEARGSCFAAFVANTSQHPVHIEASFEGMGLDLSAHARVPVVSAGSTEYKPFDPAIGLASDQVAIL